MRRRPSRRDALSLALALLAAACAGGTGGDALPGPAAAPHTCPMHPAVRQDGPGRCPICGMDLVPAAAAGGASAAAVDGPPPPRGYAWVHLDDTARARLGLQTAEAAPAALQRTVRAPGRLVLPPEARVFVAAPVMGVVTALAVRVGESVRAGAPVVYLRSPEVDQARAEVAGAATLPGGADAARARFATWGIPSTGPADRVPLASPRAGVVLSIERAPGQAFAAGDPLVTVGDLSAVEAELDLPAGLPPLSPGAPVRLELPGQTVDATFDRLLPAADEARGTVSARVRLPPTAPRTPGTPLVGSVRVDDGTGIAVPEEAIIDNGAQQVVFVDRGEVVVPTLVTVEGRGNGLVRVSGLQAGDRVVVRGQFLLDSEARLQGMAHGP